jgi:chromosome segregation ATPase
METLLERKMQSKIDELTKKSRSELEEAMKRHEREKQELAESYEQAKEGYMQAQKKAKDELIQEYKKSLDDLQSQDEELTRARESESRLKRRVDELTRELEESKRRGNDSLDEIVKKMDEMKSKHAAEVKSLNVELIYAQEGLKSSQFDHNQLKMSLDEVSARFEESQTKCEELKRTVADLERKLAEAEKMAAIAAAAKEEEENKAQMECDMEWEDEAAADKKSLHDQEQQTIYCEMAESAVQTSFESAPRSREHATQTDKVAHKTIASGSNDPMVRFISCYLPIINVISC